MRSLWAEAMTVALGASLILAACQSEGSLDGDEDEDAVAQTGGGGEASGAGGLMATGGQDANGVTDSSSTGGDVSSGAGGASTGAGGASTGAGGASTGAGGASTGAGGASTGAGGASTGAGGASTSGGSTSSASSSASTTTAASSSSSSTGSGGGPLTYDNCGFPNDGPWMQIDYGNAYTVTNPSRTYSNTPGFGEAQWTPSGQSYPEVWFLGGGSTQVSNDPIGKVASVGPGKRLQMMIGLGSLVSYSHATVCVEGRSVSTSASVLFDAYNPKNNCGAAGQMSHSWAIHATGIDIGTCLTPGDAFQAVRLEPWGGSSHLGVRRVRVTLHNAIY